MKTQDIKIQSAGVRMMSLLTLFIVHCLLFMSHAVAQEVTINVQPVQPVLPPQIGQYVDNPGKFFTIRLTNNTDEQQLLHIGLQMEMRFPEDVLMVQTRYGHIPRTPITLAPNQVKTLNPVEMKQLFSHYALSDVYIKDGMYQNYRNGIFGLMPEGQYEMFLTAYKWDPTLMSPVTLSDPRSGSTLFNVCYLAQPPRFLTPIQNVIPDDPLSMYAVTKVNRQNAMFTWAAPTMNCNSKLVTFQYNARIVRLDGLAPDEAMDNNPVVYERNRLTVPQLTIPEAYIRQMIGDNALSDIYALQVTATTTAQNENSTNYTLLENEGRSSVYLFRLQDLTKGQPVIPEVPVTPENPENPETPQKPAEPEDGYTLTMEGEEVDPYKNDSLYVFEQPLLTSPNFEDDPMGRKIYYGENINAEWRKAWFTGGKGERQDTVKFEYTLALYKGNPADTPQGIFASKPVYENKTKELKDTIKWDKIKDKISSGEYLILRVTAKATNVKSIRMLPDSLNYIDFALTQHFDDDFSCGNSTADVQNKELITKLPEKGTNLSINSWYLTLNDDCKLDPEEHTVSGTGWIAWSPMGTGNIMNCRVAVKFDKLKVNTDNVVFEGKCQTYAKSSVKKDGYTAEQVVDSIFSQTGLDNIWGNLSLPQGVKDKISKKVEGEIYDVAKAYKLGEYYGYLKQIQNKWDNIKQGNVIDLYFPVELPEQVSKLLPKDFSVQIGSMTFTPKSAVMNIIGMIAMPNSNVIKDNDVLVFGCPRLCISPDRILPEDGVLALLSNFKIQDPGSDFSLTFVAPTEPLNPAPNDGCFIRWENGEFGGLGLEIAATIPNTKRVVDGKVQKDLPALLDLRTVIRGNESAGDFIAYGSMTPFQVNDLPDWTFNTGEQIIFDHNLSENGRGMPGLADIKKWAGDTYDPKQCGSYVQTDWNAWQGVYIKEISVGFPKFAVFGSGDKGVTVGVKNMIIDGSGVTCRVFTDNLLDAQTGKCGGWKFTIDEAHVDIVQNNFDNCEIKGGFGIPLFGKKANDTEKTNAGGNNNNKKQGEDTDVNYVCQIRHLTDPKTKETYYTYDKDGKKIEHTRYTYGEKNKYAYIFKTQQVDDLYMNCFIADLKIIKDQTYFVVAAEDQDDGKTKTDVELRMAGDITLASENSAVKAISDIAKKLPMKVSMPGIHFAKLRLSNFKYADRNKSLVYKYAKDMVDNADAKQKEWEQKNHVLKTLAKSKELELSKDACYLDLGEWSLASLKKKLGPFSFELSSYKFNFESKKLSLDVEGKIGFCGDKVTAGAGLTISSDLTIPSDFKDISGYKLSNGKVDFKSVTLNCDFASVLKLNGRLDVVKDSTDSKGNKVSGYAGNIDCEIKGLFSVNCQGGYFSVKAKDQSELNKVKADAKEEGVEEYANDRNYAYGYFMVEVKSKAGIHIDPLVINRIQGGFYFNCRPKWDSSKKSYDKPIADYGCIGICLGMGFSTSAGEETLKADVDLNVIYKKNANGSGGKLTTFLFKGDVQAVSGMIDAKMTLLYQNDNTDRFLSLDITVTAGLESGTMGSLMKAANSELAAVKKEMDKFQSSIDSKVKNFTADPIGNLKGAFNDDSKSKSSASENTGDISKSAKTKAENAEKSKGTTVNLPFQLKITWKEKGVTKSPTRWHLYLGEPEKSKRCQIILLDFKSSIVNVNIGADAYLCIGNELPGNGQLPAIPTEITNFLTPNGVDTGADMAKAQRSRNNACKAMLGTDVKGGLMVGASAWGFIDIDLGLFYGGLKAIAGFDMALVNYGDAAYCVNLQRAMGKNGWYATGQFYAYLAAKFGLHIKLGKLIDKKIDIVNAGIGGVFQAGLPSPTWVDGRAKVQLKLLNGLVNINKSFHFECGDYCEAFVGNALDGFSLFGDCTIATDSLEEGWKADNAILPRDGNKLMITTEASLNSQYRLVDPSTQKNLADDTGYDAETLKLNAARTYIFDWDKNYNYYNSKYIGVKGARLFEITSTGVNNLTSRKFYSSWLRSMLSSVPWINDTWRQYMNRRWKTVESSIIMKDKSVTSSKVKDDDDNITYDNRIAALQSMDGVTEIPLYIRESQGTRYHLSATLQADRYYILVLTGTAYEVENGQRNWVEITEKNAKGKMETTRQQWIQHKFFYFRTKSAEAIPAMPTDLKPYVALAYPSGDDMALFNAAADKAQAYEGDLASPTIALNEDISKKAYQNGQLFWELRDRRAGYTSWDHTQTRNNWWCTSNNCAYVNMQPSSAFTVYKHASVSSNYYMEYNLRLGYRYKTNAPCANGLEDNATNEEKWAVYRRFITYYYGYRDKFTTYKNGRGYSSFQIEDVKTSSQCYTGAWLAKSWIESDANVKYNWNLWVKNKVSNLTCTKDTTMYLADLWFRGSDFKSWQTQGKNTSGTQSRWLVGTPLPYEKPFIGMCPTSTPVYSYQDVYNQAHTKDKFYLDNAACFLSADYNMSTKSYEAFSFKRTHDPYFYLAYLSNWVFIGGRQLNKYSFDEVPVKHATETLTLSYNGIDVQGSALIEGLNSSVYELRNKMYKTWDDWGYNNNNQPTYPLPSGEGPMYDYTVVNQNGKTKEGIRAFDTKNSSYPYPYLLKNFIQDFAAPYYIASNLDDKMAEIANTLFNYYKDNRTKYGKMSNDCNKAINNAVKNWNSLHRGQYLTVESRGFQVKVPYYQFPLIFGDCFGSGTKGDPLFNNNGVDRDGRSFSYSISGSSFVKARWVTEMSNLYFFRLRGGYPWAYYTDAGYANNYSWQSGYRYVNRDAFYASTALRNVTSLPVNVYRVDCYNINNGQYYYGGRGAAGNTNYKQWFEKKYVDPLKDGSSSVRGTAWDWIQMVGSPSVTTNDTKLESSK